MFDTFLLWIHLNTIFNMFYKTYSLFLLVWHRGVMQKCTIVIKHHKLFLTKFHHAKFGCIAWPVQSWVLNMTEYSTYFKYLLLFLIYLFTFNFHLISNSLPISCGFSGIARALCCYIWTHCMVCSTVWPSSHLYQIFVVVVVVVVVVNNCLYVCFGKFQECITGFFL